MAEALLAQFPSDELDTPATKDFVRTEIGDLRAEMMNRLRSQTVWFSGAILAAAGLIRFA